MMKKLLLILFSFLSLYSFGQFGVQNDVSKVASTMEDTKGFDLDGDGDVDILAASRSDDKISWYENLGGGSFSSQRIISTMADGAYSIYATDLDNDGDNDVLSASSIDNKIAWYENLGGGVFGSQQVITNSANGASSVFSIDLNNDGDNDVLSASSNDNKIAWYENLGGGVFGSQQVITTSAIGTESVYSIDLNNDGDNDVLSASTNDNKIAWYENLGVGVFGSQQVIDNSFNGARCVFSSDLDNDGDNDVFSPSWIDNRMVWYDNFGGGIFSTSQEITPYIDGAESVYVSDLDGDGYADVLSASTNDDKIAWYRNLGGGGEFGSQQIITTLASRATSVYATDLDNDGDNDVLSASWLDDKIAWYENLGGGVFGSQQIISTLADGAESVSTADLDNDGDEDVLSASYSDNKIAWYENLGGGVFGSQQVITTVANGARFIFTSDLDNDTNIDVLSASFSDDKIAWYENLGGGSFSSQQVISTLADGAYSIYVSDLDNDGDKDVVSASQLDDKIAWYENLGGGVFGSQQIISTLADGPRSVYGADYDGDGDEDIVSASLFDNKIAWYENQGGGVFGSQQIITIKANGARSVYSADMDIDGDEDVFSASFDNDKIAMYENYYFGSYQFKGEHFFDANQNGVKDSIDYGLPFMKTELSPLGVSGFTSNNGHYLLTVGTGTYTLNYVSDTLWNLTTDSISYTKTLTSVTPVIDSLDFGFYPDTFLTSIQPDLIGGFPRCNTAINYWVNIQNQGTTIPSGIIHLQLDDSITYISSAITPDSINGQNIYWHYDSLFFFDSEMINIQVFMPPFTSIGDTLSSYLTVHEVGTFNNIVYTNTDTLDQILVCAYDPNDKSVTPKGEGVEGFITQNQELEYLIRFQNTGNDTAITVMIRDQLDENLDWSTLQPIASSHNMQVWIEQDGEAVFKFENIMLPDSNVDFLGSQGFVKFSIQPDTGLAPLTPIYNTANIYFDFNPAVVTNTVLNTIECYSAPLPVISYNFPYLDAGVTGNYTYQWYLNDTLIVGATNDTLTPFVDGDYTVEVTDNNGCFKISLPYTHITVGLEEKAQLNTLVYPNPFKESTTILFSKSLNKDYDLLVYNIVGAEVYRFNKIAGNSVEINKNDIGKGMFLTYLIHNQTGEKVFIEKLIVQ